MSDAPRPRSTMRDVAALAGVSIKTVSRVVNEEGFVASATAARVHSAAARLDFRPNLTASTLRRSDGRSRTAALILEDSANPFSATLHRAVENVAYQRGVHVLAGSADRDVERERQLAAAFGARQVDGLIVMPTAADQSFLNTHRRAGTALVFVDRPPRRAAEAIDADVVVAANRAGADEATTHLLAHGHRRIAFLGDDLSIWTVAERRAGYYQALSRAGVPRDPALVRCGLRDSAPAIEELLGLLDAAHPPTAVFAAQNLITVGAVAALRARGLVDRVALVGFDDLPLAEFLEPGLSVVAQDPTAMGTQAAHLMFTQLDHGTTAGRRVVIPTRLITRGSGEIAAPRHA